MKCETDPKLVLLVGLAFIVFVFPFNYIDAEQIRSGVTITAGPAGTTEVCGNAIDDDKDGTVDETDCTAQAGASGGTCGLQIVSGVPINYGQVISGQKSAWQKVDLKNTGTATGQFAIKGDSWRSDAVAGAASGAVVAPPSATQISGSQSGPGNPLPSQPTTLGGIAPGATISLYFQFTPWSNPTSGSFSQAVDLNLAC